MAQKVFNRELVPSCTARDTVRISPLDIRIDDDPNLNGRAVLPDIEWLKQDFLNPAIGQIQPVLVRKKDGYPVLVAGRGRWRAAREITLAKNGPHENGSFMLKCEYVQVTNPAQIFTLTLKENIRDDPKPDDHAHNIAICIHNFGMSEEHVAGEIYQKFNLDGSPDVKWLRETLALNDLTPEAIALLKSGRLKSKAAVALAKMTPEKQREKLAELPEGKTITVAAIKRAAAPPATESIGKLPPDPPRLPKRERDLFCGIIQRWIDMDLPRHMQEMTPENAVRTVLSEIHSEIECGR